MEKMINVFRTEIDCELFFRENWKGVQDIYLEKKGFEPLPKSSISNGARNIMSVSKFSCTTMCYSVEFTNNNLNILKAFNIETSFGLSK